MREQKSLISRPSSSADIESACLHTTQQYLLHDNEIVIYYEVLAQAGDWLAAKDAFLARSEGDQTPSVARPTLAAHSSLTHSMKQPSDVASGRPASPAASVEGLRQQIYELQLKLHVRLAALSVKASIKQASTMFILKS